MARPFDYTKTPFPWFGGKSKAAPAVWAALGDVPHYVEPFCGGMAVLLQRPHEANRTYYSETVNDADGLLVNAWRSIQLHPDATAEAASNPVCEADLHARHSRLNRWRADNDLERLMGDPTFCDPILGGWWLWGQCCWIGSGWCSGKGPWVVQDGRLAKVGRRAGVHRKRPHLSNNGQGVNHAGLREPGTFEGDEGEYAYHPVTMPRLREWFAFLSARLRHVRILNGNWTRAVTGGALQSLPVRQGKGPCGVFLDPPYANTADRTADIYSEDSPDVAYASREWAIANGDNPKYRIVMAGFEGEHGDAFRAAGWREVEWFKKGHLTGGMGNVKRTGDKAGGQQHRERLWMSPHCIGADKPMPLLEAVGQ